MADSMLNNFQLEAMIKELQKTVESMEALLPRRTVFCKCGKEIMQGSSPYTWWVGNGGIRHSYGRCDPYCSSCGNYI